ncbi:hypothetical protein JCM17823_25650 [Halorubrum gandharaense]
MTDDGRVVRLARRLRRSRFTPLVRLASDRRAVVRSDERAFLLFLLLLSIVALVVFLYYTFLVLGGLPQVIPDDSPTPP